MALVLHFSKINPTGKSVNATTDCHIDLIIYFHLLTQKNSF